jgi:heme/copper-type cytochrome/quinol oxidase subunit 2
MSKKANSVQQIGKQKDKKDSSTKQSWDWSKSIPIIISIVALAFSIYTYFDLKSERNEIKSKTEHNQTIEESLQLANSIFENAGIQDTIQLLKAFEIYKKIANEIPSDLTGYQNFMNLAITRRDKLNTSCDYWIKWYLLRAKELFDNKKVQDMLKQCEE